MNIRKQPIEIEASIDLHTNGEIKYACELSTSTGHKIELKTQYGVIEINPNDTYMTVTEMFHAQIIGREVSKRNRDLYMAVLEYLFDKKGQ